MRWRLVFLNEQDPPNAFAASEATEKMGSHNPRLVHQSIKLAAKAECVISVSNASALRLGWTSAEEHGVRWVERSGRVFTCYRVTATLPPLSHSCTHGDPL